MPKLQLEIYSPFIVSIIFLIFLSKYLMFRRQHNNEYYLKYPPSPPKLPIIGNLHQLIAKLPYRSLHSLSQKYGPLMLLHLGQAPTLVVSSAEMVEEIVKHHDVDFSNRPSTTAAKILLYGGADFAFSPYGEYWRKARQICVTQLLSNKRVDSFNCVREEEVASLVDKLRIASSNGSCVNLSEMMDATLFGIVYRCLIGHKAKEGDGKFGTLSKRFLTQLSSFCFGDLFPFMGRMDVLLGLVKRLKATFDEMDALLDSMIIEDIDSSHNDQNQKDNYVQILLHLRNEGQLGLTHENLKAILLDMVVGAFASPTAAIEWAMAELLKNPRVMKKAQEEVRRVVGRKGKVDEDDVNQMDYLKCVFKETLRLHPPSPLIPREIFARIKLHGYDILPKTRVIFNVWAIQRDPKLWDKPEVFLPERFENNPIDFRGQDFGFIPFGTGRRGCPGVSFAAATLEFQLANLLYWFDWELVGDAKHETLDMTEMFGLTSYKKFPLQLVPIDYCS